MIFKIYANKGKGYISIGSISREEIVDLYIRELREDNYKIILVVKHDISLDMDEICYFEVVESSFEMNRSGGRSYVKRKDNRTTHGATCKSHRKK